MTWIYLTAPNQKSSKLKSNTFMKNAKQNSLREVGHPRKSPNFSLCSQRF